jgi:hypothetical protein
MGRDTNEKITDGVRGMYEKATGYVCFLSSRFSDPTLAGGIIINGNLILCCLVASLWMPSIRTDEFSFAGKLLIPSGRTRPCDGRNLVSGV